MNFAEVLDVAIPAGIVTKIQETSTKRVLWEKRPAGGKVYALGSKAAQWSGGADPIAYGFRKLDMPNADRLTALIGGGFCARVDTGGWYVAGTSPDLFPAPSSKNIKDCISAAAVYPEFNTDKPTKFPVNGVIDMCSGLCPVGFSYVTYSYIAYRTSGNNIYQSQSGGGSSTKRYDHFSLNVKKFQEDYGFSSIVVLTSDNTIGRLGKVVVDFFQIRGDVAVKKIGGKISININDSVFSDRINDKCYLTTDGKLYQYRQATNAAEQIHPEYGNIKDYWFLYYYSQFIQTSDVKLYACGENEDYQLGLPEAKNYSDFELVGEYSARKITSGNEATFMLTTEGKLYHTGKAVTGITDAHTTFTPIFEDLIFQDVICTPGSSGTTLVVTIKE